MYFTRLFKIRHLFLQMLEPALFFIVVGFWGGERNDFICLAAPSLVQNFLNSKIKKKEVSAFNQLSLILKASISMLEAVHFLSQYIQM